MEDFATIYTELSEHNLVEGLWKRVVSLRERPESYTDPKAVSAILHLLRAVQYRDPRSRNVYLENKIRLSLKKNSPLMIS